jgi:predicted ester cyclase
MRGAFPDLRYDIEHVVEDERAVTVRLSVSGTHAGDFFGMASGSHFVSRRSTSSSSKTVRSSRTIE